MKIRELLGISEDMGIPQTNPASGLPGGITDNEFRSMSAPMQNGLFPGYVPRPQTNPASGLPGGITDNEFRSMSAPMQNGLFPGYVPRPVTPTAGQPAPPVRTTQAANLVPGGALRQPSPSVGMPVPTSLPGALGRPDPE